MKFSARDLKKLRWQFAASAGLVAAAAVMVQISLDAERKSAADHRAAVERHARIDARLRQVRSEEEDIKNRAAYFLRQQQRGIIGTEQRLDWIEMLREIQKRMRLPDMNYEFAPQKPLEGNGGDDYPFFASAMRLHLNLVHEEDLLDFLAEVLREARAAVRVRSCNVVRLPPAEAENSLAHLGADCELDWITVRKADTAKR